jgi:hypothetical protein
MLAAQQPAKRRSVPSDPCTRFERRAQPKCRVADLGLHENASWSFPEMNSIIYLVGLVVVILAILSFFGLR